VNILLLFLKILCLWFTGYFLLHFFIKTNTYHKYLFAFPMGIGVVALIDLFLRISFSQYHFKILNLFIIFSSLSGILSFIKNAKNFKVPKKDIIFAWICITLFGLFLLFRSLIMPIEAWDSIAIHTLKVKKLTYQSDFTQYFGIPEYANPHQDYPILIHLTESWLAKDGFSENWQDYPVKSLSPICACLIILLIYHRMRKDYNSIIAFLCSIAFGLCPIVLEYAVVNLMDLPLCLFFVITLLALEQYDESKKMEWLSLALTFAIMSAFIKNEGIPFLLITLFFVATRIVKIQKNIQWNIQTKIGILIALLCFLFWIEWLLLLLINGVRESNIIKDNINLLNLISFERYKIIFVSIVTQIFDFKRWGLILLTTFLGGLVGLKIKHNVYAQYFVSMIVVLVFAYGITSENLVWHLNTSLDRTLLQISGLGFLSFFVLFSRKSDKVNCDITF